MQLTPPDCSGSHLPLCSLHQGDSFRNSVNHMDQFVPERIVSGGQTGVDRGALDAAMALGIAHGGWCPKDRLSEDGTIPGCYELQELESSDYAKRTEQNVIDSDATLILYEGPLVGGTRLTVKFASEHSKPYLTQPLGKRFDASRVQAWLNQTNPKVLNIAGPRESKYPGISTRAYLAVLRILESTS